MDLAALRKLLRPLVLGLSHHRHKDLERITAEVGLPPPGDGSKAERMEASFEATSPEDLPKVAVRLLLEHPPPAEVRNQIQELLWSEDTGPQVPKKCRREVARALEAEDLYLDQPRFDALLTSLWVIEDDAFAAFMGHRNRSLRGVIEQHVYRNPGDITPETLFDKLGAYECSDRRFCLFLEGLASPDVRPDEAEQRRFVTKVNEALGGCSAELRESGNDGGYPTFSLVSLHAGTSGRPKNIIFASSVKPDLRFRDAINNDVEIVTNAEKVLVYDQPVPTDGLRWQNLQDWWAEKNGGLEPGPAKKSLYQRLHASLPSNSPPQQFLFRTFFETFKSLVPNLPALLPEVWLHWDPKTVQERGPVALANFRMDFLMLLPHGVRVVIEVDGKHHYAQGDRADPRRYALMAAGDRDLRLAGYHVFRFGAAELTDCEPAKVLVKDFFHALFRKFNVPVG